MLVAVAQDSASARRAAHDLAAALRSVDRTRAEEIGVATDLRAELVLHGARAIVRIEVEPGVFELTAMGADGRSWPPRPVARRDGEAVDSEQVAAAGCSMVAAVLSAPEAPSAPPASTSNVTPIPSPPPAQPPATAPAPASPPAAPSALAPPGLSPSPAGPPQAPTEVKPSVTSAAHPATAAAHAPTPAEAPVSHPPESNPRGGASARAEAAFVGANVAPQLLFHPGATVGAWARSGPLGFGALYGFYPGAVVEGASASILLTRHTFALGARAELRYERWTVAASAGPLLEMWLRSTRAVDSAATATPSSTHVTVGGFARGGVTFWIRPGLGLDAGLGVEVCPDGPAFRGPSGGDLLTPNIGRLRVDLGLAAEFL